MKRMGKSASDRTSKSFYFSKRTIFREIPKSLSPHIKRLNTHYAYALSMFSRVLARDCYVSGSFSSKTNVVAYAHRD